MTPCVSAFGILTNILVIATISDVKREKELKEMRHYDYMRLNSITHCLILVIQIVGTINECTHEFWCSQIDRLILIQYYKIIVSELLGTAFRFMSNFTYLAFLLSRLSLLGKEHGKLVMYVSKEKSIGLYLAITSFLSLVLSAVKFFRYMTNEVNLFSSGNDTDNFPDKLISFADGNLRTFFSVRIFLIFNILCDLVNYFVFLFVNLGLDICMVLELKKTFAEKAKKIELSEKQKRKHELAIKRAILMVVLNAILGLFLKFPLLLNNFFEFYANEIDVKITSSTTKHFDEKNSIYFYYIHLKGGEMFEVFVNFLYFVNISLSFFFFYKFDKNFHSSFQRFILKEEVYVESEKTKSKIDLKRNRLNLKFK